MAENMKPVGVIELFHVDASCYGKNGGEIADANMFVDLPVGTELYTAAQLEQARREERDEMIDRIIEEMRNSLLFSTDYIDGLSCAADTIRARNKKGGS